MRRRALRHPEAFRRAVLLNAESPQPFAEIAQPWQTRDFAALDPAWMAWAGVRDDADCIRRAFIERPRGHSKTSDMAMQIAWVLIAAKRQVVGLVAAADRDQANLVYDALRRLVRANPGLCGGLQFVQHVVKNPATASRMEVISSDVSSSWGALPDFVVCDELCHWRKQDLWQSLLSSAAKKPECVLVILTNAGVGRGWQWDVREHARRDRAWYFSSLDGPQAPWITDDWLAEQKALLPQPVFERLWLNVWQHSDGEFVSLAEAQACRDAQLKPQERGHARTPYVAAVDYAEKHDFTVGCVCHREGVRIVVDRMDVVKPSQSSPTPVQWVDDWIAEVADRFHDVTFFIDPYQLVGTIQRLSGRYHIIRFEFLSGAANHSLAVTLRQLILEKQVAWYAECGQVDDLCQRDDLETELASLLLKESASGRVRIDHHRDGVHHDDRAFALGVACLHLCQSPAGADFLAITPPTMSGEFAW